MTQASTQETVQSGSSVLSESVNPGDKIYGMKQASIGTPRARIYLGKPVKYVGPHHKGHELNVDSTQCFISTTELNGFFSLQNPIQPRQ